MAAVTTFPATMERAAGARLSAPAARRAVRCRPDAIARVGVLVLQPIEVDRLGEFDPTDPCELCLCGEPGDDTSFELASRRRRTFRLVRGRANGVRCRRTGPTLRNQLAWTIFDAEADLAPGAVLPWSS